MEAKISPSTLPAPRLITAALISIQILFGINYVVSKQILVHFPPLVWASVRMVIAAFMMLIVALLSGKPFPKGGKPFFVALSFWALWGVVINQISFTVGLKYTTVVNSSIINTLIPVITLLFVTLKKSEKLTPKRAIGFVMGLVGVLSLRKIENFVLTDETLVGDLLILVNCISFSFFIAFSKPFLEKYDRIWVTALLFCYGAVATTLISLPAWNGFVWPEFTPGLMGSVSFALIGATLITYFLNNWALAYARSSQVALYIYFQPVVAAFLASVFLGELITLRTILSASCIFAGMLIAVRA